MSELSRLVLEVDSKGVVTANGNLDLFKKKSDEAAKAASGVETANKNNAKSFDLVNQLTNLNTLAMGAANLAVIKFANSIVTVAGNMEVLKAQLQVVTGNTAIAKSTFESLQKFASETPFSINGITDTGIQLMQVGVAAEDLQEQLQMLGDVSGGSQEKLNRIMMNYTQILSVGKASTMDIRQFAQANLPIYKELENVTGRTGEALQKMITDGEITGDIITAAFKRMTAEGGMFYNGMQIQAETWQGKLSTLKDSVSNLGAEFGNLWMLNFAKNAADAITAVSDKAAEFFKWVNQQGDNAKTEKTVMSGGGTDDQVLEVADKRIDAIYKELNRYNELRREVERSVNNVNKNAQLDWIENETAELRYNLEYWENRKNAIINTQNAEEAYTRGKAATEALKRQFETNLALQNGIETDPDNAKVRAIKAEIEAQKALYNVFYAGKDTDKIAENIAFLEKELEKLLKSKQELLDWQKILKSTLGLEDVSTGSQAVTDYISNIETSLNGSLAFAQAFGGSVLDVYEDYSDRVKKAVHELLQSGIWTPDEATIQRLISFANRLEAAGQTTGFKTPQFGAAPDPSFMNTSSNPFSLSPFGSSTGFNVGYSESDSVWLDEEKVRKEEEQAARLAEIYRNLGEQLKQFAADATFDALWDMGEALYEGGNAAEAFGRSLLQSILRNVPAMLFQTGFQMAISGNVYGGLALMAVSGLGAVAGGYLTKSLDSENNDDEKQRRLENLTKQLNDLILQTKADAEYYLTSTRSKNADYKNSVISSTSVNDAIITKDGKVIQTHPEDYLIATKTPGALVSSNQTNVQVTIVNSISNEVDVDIQEKTLANGSKELVATIRKLVRSDIAHGEFDSALASRNTAIAGTGRRVSS